MRIIGNLVHTHDVNRQKCIDEGAPGIIASILKSFALSDSSSQDASPDQDCLHIILVVTYNLCAEYAPAQLALIECEIFLQLSQVVEHTFSSNVQLCLAAVRLIEELASHDHARTCFPDKLVVSLCKPILVIDSCTNYVEQVDESLTELRLDVVVICSSILELLSDDVDSTRSASWLFAEVSHLGVSSHRVPCNIFGGLLWFIRYSDPPLLTRLQSDNDEDNPRKLWEQVKARAGRALALGTSRTKALKDVCKEPVLALLTGWLKEPDVIHERPDLVIIIGLSLGNLACDDFSSRRLVEDYDIVPSLVLAFQSWLPSSSSSASDEGFKRGRPGEQAQVLHALCGLARNLSVAEPSKSRIGSSQILQASVECLRPEFDMVPPLIGSALGLIRHLCRYNGPNVDRLLAANLFKSLVALIQRVDQPYLVLESYRLLSTVINTVGKSSTTLGDEVLNSPLAVEPIARFTLLTANAKQMLLLNEALVSVALLTLSSSLAPRLYKALIESHPDSTGEPATQEGCDDKYANALEAILGYWLPKTSTELKAPVQMQENCRAILLSIVTLIRQPTWNSPEIVEPMAKAVFNRISEVPCDNSEIQAKNQYLVETWSALLR